MSSKNPYFINFQKSIKGIDLPEQFGDPFYDEVHPLCSLAAQELQAQIQLMKWNHNFGFKKADQRKAIGKMFGILLVSDKDGNVGYLAAFSGKIGERNDYPGFVPPIFDTLSPGGFLDRGMKQLRRLNLEIEQVEENTVHTGQLKNLKAQRTKHSNSLQNQICESYQFLNVRGERKGLKQIFKEECGSKPPGGAGDCSAPRLLQYAFKNEFRPIAMVEFWWGRSESSPQWEHGKFYRPCENKCKPILKHMLAGL